MNKLERMLKESHDNRPFFMAHMIAGFPNLGASMKVARSLVAGGADILEIQIPFSDPMADGPTIAVSSEEALANGMTVAKSLTLIHDAAQLGKPIAVMSYINPIFRFGIEKFVRTIAKAGAHALIVPDCPFDTEEGVALRAACEKDNVCLIPVISPGVPEARLRTLLTDARGFVYCTSRQGITGANSTFAMTLPRFVESVRKLTKIPIAVGFGIKSRTDVLRIGSYADIAVVGSAFVATVRKTPAAKLSTAIEKQTRAFLR
jgi:tryptophan synthase alpha subunit